MQLCVSVLLGADNSKAEQVCPLLGLQLSYTVRHKTKKTAATYTITVKNKAFYNKVEHL